MKRTRRSRVDCLGGFEDFAGDFENLDTRKHCDIADFKKKDFFYLKSFYYFFILALRTTTGGNHEIHAQHRN